MSCGGLNIFDNVPVPVGNGDGAPIDVSGMIAAKTIYLSGTYSGRYVILGTHDNIRYVPILSFDGGEGPQTIRRDIEFTLKSIKVRRQADKTVVINVASQATCPC